MYHYRTTISIRQLTMREEIDAILDEWRALYDEANCPANTFLSPDWVLAWLDASTGKSLLFLEMRRLDQLVGLAPLVQSQSSLGVKTLEVAAGRVSEYQELVLARPQDRLQCIEKLLDHVTTNNLADLIVLDRVPEKAVISGTISRVSHARYGSRLVFGPNINNDSTAIFRKLAKEAGKKQRKLAKSGQVKFRVASVNESEMEGLVDGLFDWKQHWLASKGALSSFHHSQESRLFMKNLLKQSLTNCDYSQRPCLFSLWLDDKPVAISIGYLTKAGYYCYTTGHHPEFSEFSPGTILLNHIVKWLCDNGCSHYDFLGHPEHFKDRFSNVQIPLRDCIIALNWRGKIVGELLQLPVKSLAKNIFYRLPHAVRLRVGQVARH